MKRTRAVRLYRRKPLQIQLSRSQTTLVLKCPILLGFVLAVIAYGAYAICLPTQNILWSNIFIYIFSVALTAASIQDIVKRGITVSNVFGSIYFLTLAVNNLNISGLQREKTLIDIYYLLVGPIIFWLIVYIFDVANIKFRIKKAGTFDPNTVALALLLLFVVMKMCIFKRTGIRLLDGTWGHGGFSGISTGSQYQVSGFSGMAQLSMWLALFLIPFTKKWLKIAIGMTALLLNGVFMVSRLGVMMIGLYLVMCFIYSQGKKLLKNKKNIRILCLIALVSIIVFTVLGNLRQTMRGWGDDPGQIIANLLKSSVKNDVVNWLYSYTAFNHEILIQIHANAEHPMTMYSIFSPLVRIAGGYAALANYQDAVYHISGLNGFNMSSFVGPMIYEMGVFYVVQTALLGVYVGLLSYVSRVQRAEGFRVFLITLSAMLIFGNDFTTVIYCFISFAAILMFFFIKETEDEQ